jgi:hypothetical protein
MSLKFGVRDEYEKVRYISLDKKRERTQVDTITTGMT